MQTHSLMAAEYNGVVGSVTGAAVEKNGVRRVPVSLQLSDGTKKTMLMQSKNLTILPVPDIRLQRQLCEAAFYGHSEVIKNV